MKASTISLLTAAAVLMALPARPLKAKSPEGRGITNDTIDVVRQYLPGQGGESAIIVTDRETYIAGEHVWYVLNISGKNKNYNWQSIAGYAEILNCRNMPVAQGRILLDDNGRGSGMLTLPDTISSGDYILRGYTRAMIPYGPENYFSKTIRIFNPYSTRETYDRIITGGHKTGPHLTLCSGSGISIPGSPARIIVKATGRDGTGCATSIVFAPPDGNPCDTVITDSTGMGSVVLTLPESGKLTAAAIIDSVKVEAEIAPQELSSPALTVEKQDGRVVHFRIHPPSGTDREVTGSLHLAIADQYGIVFYRQLEPAAGDLTIDLPAGEQHEGIHRALLYDASGNLLSTRLFMADDNDSGNPEQQPVRFIPGEDSITVTLPEWASYAVLSAACGEEDSPDIRSWSILEPWLPTSSMNDPFLRPFLTGKATLNNDLLMLLDQPAGDPDLRRPERVMAETRGLAVTGTVLDLDTQLPAADMILFINIPGKECFLQYARSDSSGRFTFIIPPGTGNGEIVVHPQDTAANIVLKIASPFSHDYRQMIYQSMDTRKVADPAALRMSINSQVMRIYGLTDTDTVPQYQTLPGRDHFYGSSGRHIRLSDYIMLPDMEEVFFELIPGVDLVKNRNKYEFNIVDLKTGKETRESPLVFIDGTYNTDPDVIAELAPEKVEYIDVILKRYRSGALLLPPVISIITKKGDFRLQKLPQSALRIKYPFSDASPVFLPFTEDSEGRIPAYGNTLLWAASPVGSSNKKVRFRLPAPDYNSKIRLTLTLFGEGRLPASFSCLCDFPEN